MSQFMLSVHGNVDAEMPSMEEMQPMFAAVDAFNTKLQASGAWVFTCGLMPIDSATTVDNTAGEGIVTDGPFAESKEYLGGFWVVEAADLDAALALAQEASAACQAPVEVRPLQSE